METLPTIIKEGQIKNFSTLSPSILPKNELSIYHGNIISDDSIKRYSIKIRRAFPSLPPEFYNILLEMAKEEGFTDERFRDAAHHVIKTCLYPTPTIASFISFDKRIKIFDYEGYLKLCDDGLGHNYKSIKFKNRPRPVWIHVNDIAEFNLKSEL